MPYGLRGARRHDAGRTATEPLAVQTIGLVKRFGDVTAVDGLNLAVPTGVSFGIGSVRFAYFVDVERGRQANDLGTAAATIGLDVALVALATPMYVAVGPSWLWARAWLPVVILGAALYAVLLGYSARLFARREEALLGDIVEARS